GPPMVGKTAIINDVVCRRKANRRSKSTRKGHIWHIFPQRLISGMSYVGQWENRLLAILKEVKKKKLILYFDDLIGLYFAGISAQSSLNVAMVMKPFVERRDIRILAEITPEKFQKLKELDRGFADLFHVIPVSETDEQLSWEIMLSTQRHLEELEGCEFSLEALPELMNISRRYMKNLAFPGKSARLMGQLAVKYRHKTVSRHDVLKTFHERSGLSLTLLDDRKKLAWKDVVQSLKEDVVGQEAALEAMANSVCIAKARLNDTQRPLATFLFLGPSGVGKTQCAVSLAKYLFGSEDRIIRFDMNEYMTSTAVSNLCGTLEKPEGLLTGTIRRQPFSVILLDEIEKAHSDVYDLLLQVLGEGRLTDSLGRTTDFTNTFIVMTSNLGVRENWSSTGFHRGEDQKGLSYRKAVQNFFRPEFYNRIDQIIPFKQLARNEISEIARHMIKKVLVREGLSRRYSFVNVDQKVIDEIAREGFHPQFGARALKRSVERMLSQPMARKLSETDSSTPIILNIDREEGSVTIQSKTLNLNIESSDRKSNIPLDEPEMLLKTIDERVASVDKALDKISPDGMINTESISSTEFYYFQCRDVTQHIQYESRKLWNSFKSSAKTRQSKAKNYPGREKQKIFYIADPDYQFPLEVILKHGKPMKYLEEHGIQAKVLGEEPGDKLRRILSETAWLEALYSQSPDKEPQDVRLSLYPYSDQQNREMLHYLKDLYLEYFSDFMKFEVELEDSRESDATVIKVSGPGASLLCQREQGVHIFFHEAVNIYPVQVDCYPGATEGKARDLSQEQDSSEKQNHNRIIRFYHSEDYSFDSQSGLLVKGLPGAFTLKTIKMAGFTLDSAGEES
ncbi:MAG: AAA family ATPase, partial [Spirochaetota bacterium]|nr:AAA family ATPase [Spirochaetota bacterium]